MNRLTKSIVLFVLLAFPVIIFIFLKSFGVNQYDLPVYFSDGVDTTFTDCEFGPQPHLIPSYDLPMINGSELKARHLSSEFGVYYFSQQTGDIEYENIVDQLARVQGSFEKWDLLNFVLITSENPTKSNQEIASYTNYNLENWFYCYANPVYTNQLARCGFVLDYDAIETHVNKWVILVDNNRLIRGYYDLTDPEEVDRLIVEIKILRDNYKST